MRIRKQAVRKQVQSVFRPLRMEYTPRQAVVEGCVRILCYDQNRIVLQTTAGTLGFEGDGLRICRMAGGAALVRGHIATVHVGEDTVCG